MTTVTLRQLNRWTLTRQMLLERQVLDPVVAIECLAGMQAQFSPSPYIGLWSRLQGFRREVLEEALLADRVLKASLQRVTLHLVSAREYGHYRMASPKAFSVYTNTVKLLESLGVDLEMVRARVMAAVEAGPVTRRQVMELTREIIPADLPDYSAWGVFAVTGTFINCADNALFGQFGSSSYRLAPSADVPLLEAHRHVAAAYLGAFGPATRADLAQWSGQLVSDFAPALDSLDLVSFKSEDGRTLIDLPNAPRPEPKMPAPVRFLPKWDNLLLAYAKRERVLPEEYRKVVIRKNGDVLPTFLVDGWVAGTWESPLRGKAALVLSPLGPISARDRRAVEAEGESLLAWLRPDRPSAQVLWKEP